MCFSQSSEGNAFFKNKQYAQAIEKYTEAINIDANNHTYWSNRSACHAGLENWEESANDARQTILVNKKFIKGYFRLSTALKNINDLDGAREALQRGLAIEPMNADLKSNMRVRQQFILSLNCSLILVLHPECAAEYFFLMTSAGH